MAKVLVSDQYLGDIADAIRTKNGTNNTYTPAQMATAIGAINTGGGSGTLNLQIKTATPNQATQMIVADTGYDGLSQVIVNPIPSEYIIPRGTASISQNGNNIDIANYAAVNVLIPMATGTFTTNSSTGNQTVTINYIGNGYPLACMIFIEGGAYNSANTEWYNSTQKYAVGQWTMHKSVQTSTPTYTTSGTQNQGVTTAVYKNSTTSSTSYTRSGAMNTNVFSSSNASNAATTCVRFKGNKELSIFIADTSYGLLASTTYRYYIIYST